MFYLDYYVNKMTGSREMVGIIGDSLWKHWSACGCRNDRMISMASNIKVQAAAQQSNPRLPL
ncbi:hypothetical protein [Paenibacillus sinopodophylli]|uniref:hypothetical protein n=1 Tax=Paenibacillus sinopodophylli TaxID=1837342 RepID=UPI00110CF4FC|nr:hypothetical protein [Paenibacillus sinopodophylli]